MANPKSCGKLFEIPDMDDTDELCGLPREDVVLTQRLFRPNSNKETRDNSNDETNKCSSPNKPREGTIKNRLASTSNSSSHVPVPKYTAGPSHFEQTFSKLKSSKFYEPPSTTTNEKCSDEPETFVKPANKITSKTYSVLVNPRQKGNPVLKHIQNVPWEYAEVEPDYVLGQTTCALYLSLKYHNLYPNYIHNRLKSLGKDFQLRVLLVVVDVTDPHPALKELSKIAILADCTLMVAWSAEEAGRYIETYKSYENKPPDMLMEKQENDTFLKLVDALSSVKSVNRTNATTLLSTFNTMRDIFEATPEKLAVCPGMGPHKANKLHEILHQPFLKSRVTMKND